MQTQQIYFNVEKTLFNLSAGQCGRVVNISSVSTNILLHYAHLGLVVGQDVKVICLAPHGRALLVDVRGCAFAVEADICKKIVVEVV